ncbi:NAD(P)-dependent oxidoreductase [Candidatus Pelagibacter sp.]|nr:NAD(P)-dependent oxidoreductase [Candidatus Pelagibacter sp.]
MKKNFLILGGNSIIGKKTVDFLKKENFVKSLSSKDCNLLKKKEVETLLGNLKKKYILIIFSFITKNKDSKSIFFKNLEMMSNVADALDINRISKIVFISSIEVYGQVPQNPILESNKENPRNLYGLAKFTCEQIFKLKIISKKLLILRLPGIYGYGDNFQSVIGKFINSAIKFKKITINSTGEDKRDFLNMDDFPKILNNLLLDNAFGIINIVSGKSHSIKYIAETISRYFKKQINISFKEKSKNKVLTSISKFEFCQKKILRKKKNYYFTDIDKGIYKYISQIKK